MEDKLVEITGATNAVITKDYVVIRQTTVMDETSHVYLTHDNMKALIEKYIVITGGLVNNS